MAAKSGIRRFIFISSIGVNGEFNFRRSFTEKDEVHPANSYAISKWEAEQVLHEISRSCGMEVVILRPPMVYGPDAPGNFARLMCLIKVGIPLPLGNISNLRSFIYISNLVDAITVCFQHPKAAGETFLVSDGEDVSTPDLIKMIASSMNKKPVLFSLHSGILKALCKIVGKGEELEKLTGTLVVDSSKIRNLLGWKPPFTLKEGIRETVLGA
jgi:nucleoside-diphosphate-sugar epimerase